MRAAVAITVITIAAIGCSAPPVVTPSATVEPTFIQTPPRTPSPDPSTGTAPPARTAAPTSIATGTPRPLATPRAEFGVIVNFGTMGGDPVPMPQLRSEVDPAPLAEFPSGFYRQWRGAVSLDGRTLAYWHDGGTAGWELRILETSALDRPRTVLRLRDELPEGLLWSGDSGGLVFGVSDRLTGQGVIGQYTALRTVDLAAGKTTELARDKKWFTALAWDRKAGLLAATETSADGAAMTGYLLWERGVLRRIVLEGAPSLIGSQDATRIAAVYGGWGNIEPPNYVRVWPIVDHTRYVELPVDPLFPRLQVQFRPQSDQLLISKFAFDREEYRSELWTPGQAPRGIPLAQGSRFRPDGSAVISDEGEIFELDTGRVGRIDLGRTGVLIPRVSAVVRLR